SRGRSGSVAFAEHAQVVAAEDSAQLRLAEPATDQQLCQRRILRGVADALRAEYPAVEVGPDADVRRARHRGAVHDRVGHRLDAVAAEQVAPGHPADPAAGAGDLAGLFVGEVPLEGREPAEP